MAQAENIVSKGINIGPKRRIELGRLQARPRVMQRRDSWRWGAFVFQDGRVEVYQRPSERPVEREADDDVWRPDVTVSDAVRVQKVHALDKGIGEMSKARTSDSLRLAGRRHAGYRADSQGPTRRPPRRKPR